MSGRGVATTKTATARAAPAAIQATAAAGQRRGSRGARTNVSRGLGRGGRGVPGHLTHRRDSRWRSISRLISLSEISVFP